MNDEVVVITGASAGIGAALARAVFARGGRPVQARCPDSRALPGRSAEEVAAGLVELLERPRADVYSQPAFQQRVVAYSAAEDLREVERKPPLATRG